MRAGTVLALYPHQAEQRTRLPLGRGARLQVSDRARIDPDMLDSERFQHVFQCLAVQVAPIAAKGPIVSKRDASDVNARPTRWPDRSRAVRSASVPALLSRTGTKNVLITEHTPHKPTSRDSRSMAVSRRMSRRAVPPATAITGGRPTRL